MTELKTVAERIRAATAGLLEKADEGRAPSGNGGKCQGLRNGERGAERARDALESAGGTLERATAAFEPVVQRQRWPWPQNGRTSNGSTKGTDGSAFPAAKL